MQTRSTSGIVRPQTRFALSAPTSTTAKRTFAECAPWIYMGFGVVFNGPRDNSFARSVKFRQSVRESPYSFRTRFLTDAVAC